MFRNKILLWLGIKFNFLLYYSILFSLIILHFKEEYESSNYLSAFSWLSISVCWDLQLLERYQTISLQSAVCVPFFYNIYKIITHYFTLMITFSNTTTCVWSKQHGKIIAIQQAIKFASTLKILHYCSYLKWNLFMLVTLLNKNKIKMGTELAQK